MAARTVAISLLVLCGAIVGCTVPAGDEEARPPWNGATLRPELHIGVPEGPDELMFGRVSALAVARSGRIYVSDTEPVVIRAYSPGGEYLGDVSREGQGPGEYAWVAGMATLPDGTLVVWDWGNRRLTAYRPDGGIAWSTPAQSSFMLGAVTVDQNGVVHLLASEGEATSTGEAPRYFLRRYRSNGEPAGLLELPTSEPPIAGYAFLDMIRFEISNFEIGTLQALSPAGYLVTGPNDAYRIELQDPEAPVVLTRELEPAVIEGPEREEIERFVALLKGRVAAMGRQVRSDPIPATKPLFRAIEIGQEGRVWLRRYVAGELDPATPEAPPGEQPRRRWPEPTVFDVWEPDGTFLGTIRLPDGMILRTMRGDRIWGTEIDDAGIERVVRYQIIPVSSQ